METAIVSMDERIAARRAQSALFLFLGRMLEDELDANALALLRTTLREPLAELGMGIPDDVLFAEPDEVLPRLAVEFTALFVQPGAVSPYASVFETGALSQAPADRAARLYREAGFRFQHVHSGEFPDHVGTMLAFVATQFAAEADRLEQGDEPAAAQAQARRGRFLLEELGGWAPAWCRLAASAANHSFYANLLTLIERVLWEEIAVIAPPRRLRELWRKNSRRPARRQASPEFRKASGL